MFTAEHNHAHLITPALGGWGTRTASLRLAWATYIAKPCLKKTKHTHTQKPKLKINRGLQQGSLSAFLWLIMWWLGQPAGKLSGWGRVCERSTLSPLEISSRFRQFSSFKKASALTHLRREAQAMATKADTALHLALIHWNKDCVTQPNNWELESKSRAGDLLSG